MPYSKIAELPKAVRKNLPPDAQKMFMEVFNNSMEKYGETGAFRVAWGVVKKSYAPGKGGKWEKKNK